MSPTTIIEAQLDQLVSLLLFILFTLYFLTDIPQRLQFYRYSRAVASRLLQLEAMVNDSIRKVRNYISRLGVSEPQNIVDRFINNYFMIEPVSIEPTDIIKRLDHIISTNEKKAKEDLRASMKHLTDDIINNLGVALAIASALYTVYKIYRHYYLLGRRYENWILLMQLAMILPQVTKELSHYVKAIDGIVRGTPIGDSVGPLVAFKLLGLSERREIVEDTVVGFTEIDGRKVYVIKAKGPGARVGKPGKALAKLAEELQCNIARVITVDAALKMEGEPSGLVAVGSGAAIGDLGPEKIEIERVTVKCGAPLDAVIVKMSSEEAINTINKDIQNAVDEAYNKVLEIIRTYTKPGDVVVVIGVGNSVGVY